MDMEIVVHAITNEGKAKDISEPESEKLVPNGDCNYSTSVSVKQTEQMNGHVNSHIRKQGY